jgi:hypothetical protein
MITAEQTIAAIIAAVEEYGPNWIDPNAGGTYPVSCRNVYSTEEGPRMCIGAKAAAILGADIQSMSLSSVNNGPIGLTVHAVGLDVDGDSLMLLTRAQSLQDKGSTWGEVLADVNDFYLGLIESGL